MSAASDPFAPLDVDRLAPRTLMVRRALRHPGFLVGTGIVLLVALAGLFAPWISPHDPDAQALGRRLIPPVWDAAGRWEHPLGTDHLGRDYLSRLIHGTRVSLIVGLFTAVVSGTIGTVLGLLGGYFGGRVDAVVMYLVTTRLSLPSLMVALALVAAIGGSLTTVVLVLGFLLWDRFAIVVRSAVQQIRSADYVAAAVAAGASPLQVIAREVLPNVASAIIVVATLEMALAILAEAALSFLGLGVRPPTPSWGLMVAEGRQFMFFKPYLIALPGAAIFLLVVAVNLMGDGLRDITAPEGRH
ncbi:MAG: ABC transporter permease [Rhodospirillales bacterium]